MNKPALLIVDDDPQVLAAVRRDLRSRYRDKYTVMSASSGQEALGAMRELKSRGDSLAVIICDQRMPGMNGSELLAQSRAIYPLARRVLLTALALVYRCSREGHQRSTHQSSIIICRSQGILRKSGLFPAIDDLLDAWQSGVAAGIEGPALGRPPVVAAFTRDQGFSRGQSHSVSLD